MSYLYVRGFVQHFANETIPQICPENKVQLSDAFLGPN